MKIKLSYFLGKRGLTLEKYCRKTSIKSHEELAAHLLENKIECPPASHTRSLFSKLTKRKKIQPAVAKEKQRSEVEKRTGSAPKRTSKKRKNWSS